MILYRLIYLVSVNKCWKLLLCTYIASKCNILSYYIKKNNHEVINNINFLYIKQNTFIVYILFHRSAWMGTTSEMTTSTKTHHYKYFLTRTIVFIDWLYCGWCSPGFLFRWLVHNWLGYSAWCYLALFCPWSIFWTLWTSASTRWNPYS